VAILACSIHLGNSQNHYLLSEFTREPYGLAIAPRLQLSVIISGFRGTFPPGRLEAGGLLNHPYQARTGTTRRNSSSDYQLKDVVGKAFALVGITRTATRFRRKRETACGYVAATILWAPNQHRFAAQNVLFSPFVRPTGCWRQRNGALILASFIVTTANAGDF
jgi:hypothetical protein